MAQTKKRSTEDETGEQKKRTRNKMRHEALTQVGQPEIANLIQGLMCNPSRYLQDRGIRHTTAAFRKGKHINSNSALAKRSAYVKA